MLTVRQCGVAPALANRYRYACDMLEARRAGAMQAGSETEVMRLRSRRRVAIVEDEVLIAILLEDILDMLGCEIVGPATTLQEASNLLATSEPIDMAILDINLGSDPVYPVADQLIAAGVEVIFATGSHRSALPDRFASCKVLEKPYAFAAVERAVSNMAKA